MITQRKYSPRGYISGEKITKIPYVRRESNRKGKHNLTDTNYLRNNIL